METFIAQIVGLYLLLALPPVVVAWRRGLGERAVRTAFVAAVLLGWTLIGYVWAWVVALGERPDRCTLLIVR